MPPESDHQHFDNNQHHNDHDHEVAAPTTKRVVIAGGGPGGVLAALFLLRRNQQQHQETDDAIRYHVTLIDDRQNFGRTSMEDLAHHRSWMIGLASHGLTAIREIPGLFEGYVSKVGVELQSASIHLGSKEIKVAQEDTEGYIVDRNYVVWALQQYLYDKYGNATDSFQGIFHTKMLYVDAENKRVLLRTKKSNEKGSADGQHHATGDGEYYLNYDILLGCDGIRSVVRSGMQQRERTMECRVSDIFAQFKAVHVQCPPSYDPASLHLLPSCLPSSQGIALPEKGDMLNISIGFYRNKTIPEEMASDDPAVVAAYLRKHILKSVPLVDVDDFARQWTAQAWNTTGQVHCNMYHSERLSALLLGDAAHATSPSIGMGMNTALGDAAALNQLLDAHKDDWTAVLPAYSQERVKEGRALSDLAYYLFSQDEAQGLRILISSGIRNFLHKWFPKNVWPDPQMDIGLGTKLSVVYERATRLGILGAVRRTNDALRLQWEEEAFGMVPRRERKLSETLLWWTAGATALAVGGGGVLALQVQNKV